MEQSSKKQLTSGLLLLITSSVWGFAFVAQVMAAEANMGSFLFNGLRYLLGATALLPLLFLKERNIITRTSLKKSLIQGSISGIIMMAAVNFQQYGINANHNAGKSGFITALYIVLIPITTALLFRQKTHFTTWIAIAVTMIGLFLISVPATEDLFDPADLIGDVLVLISAFFWTAQILCVDRFSKENSPILFSVMQFAICGLSSMVISFFVDDFSSEIFSASILPVLYGGLISVAIGYTIQVVAQKNASPAIASIAMAAESVFAAIGGYLILKEHMTNRQLLGAVLVVIAILLSQFAPIILEKQKNNKKSA